MRTCHYRVTRLLFDTHMKRWSIPVHLDGRRCIALLVPVGKGVPFRKSDTQAGVEFPVEYTTTIVTYHRNESRIFLFPFNATLFYLS